MSPKWMFDTVKHRCLTVSNTHFGDMRDSGNTPPPSLRIIWSLSPLALTPTEAHMLRFLACTSDHYGIHTHAICTVPKLKLPLIRSLLYRRIFEFCFLLLTQNYSLYYTVALILASVLKNARFSRCAKIAPPRALPKLTYSSSKKVLQSAPTTASPRNPWFPTYHHLRGREIARFLLLFKLRSGLSLF